ncbi:MAG: lipid-binding SYLF domain-containing protein [Bryobacteraceae bacterium]|nr:lipid-binding SYLF domain-containing protein [Bryobacteraceae bacterium]
MGFVFAVASQAQPAHVKRLNAATTVLTETLGMADRSIPQDLLDRSRCIVVVPGLKKGAFIFGGRYGRGFLSCRKQDGVGWTAPGGVRIEGGSFGLQAGGKETDVILLVMNERGVQRLMTSRFTLGGQASVAAGPVGRTATAETDALLTAEILSWSRSRGVFAGVSLQGATLRQDLGTNRELYGRTIENREVIEKDPAIPPSAGPFIELLNRHSSRR